MQLMNISELKSHPRNGEFFDDIVGDSWGEFLKSVKTSGVIEPVVVTQDKVIVSGHQRVRACKELNIKQVLTEMHSYDSEDNILKDLIETNLRQRGIGNPNPVKLGKCIKELERIYGFKEGRPNKLANNYLVSDQSHTEAEFANTLGISLPTLKNYKKLADLIPEVQDFLDTGMISATTALAINRQLSRDDQVELLNNLDVTKQYTAKEIQKYIDANKDKFDVSSREKFEKDRADRLQNDCEKLRDTISVLESQISQADSDDNKKELEDLRTKYDAAISQQESYKKEIEELRNAQFSQGAQEANAAYSFYKSAEKFVNEVIGSITYDYVIANNQNNACGDYIIKACNMLIDSATDVLNKFKVSDIIDFY